MRRQFLTVQVEVTGQCKPVKRVKQTAQKKNVFTAQVSSICQLEKPASHCRDPYVVFA